MFNFVVKLAESKWISGRLLSIKIFFLGLSSEYYPLIHSQMKLYYYSYIGSYFKAVRVIAEIWNTNIDLASLLSESN